MSLHAANIKKEEITDSIHSFNILKASVKMNEREAKTNNRDSLID